MPFSGTETLVSVVAVALLCGIQAVELRSKLVSGDYDARAILSEATVPLYLAGRRAASGEPDSLRPLHWNDLEEFIQPKVEGLLASISGRGEVLASIETLRAAIFQFASSSPSTT